jgi:hypothetical protein
VQCSLQFQACDASECLPPRTEPFTLAIDVEPHAPAKP